MRGCCLALLWLLGCGPSPGSDVGTDAGRPDVPLVDVASPDVSALDAATDAGPSDAAVDAPDGGRGRIDAIVALLSATPADASAIDTILHDVAWNEGWPLREGTRWLFATTIATAEPVHFTSDVNGWSTSAHPASRAGTGRHHWVVLDDAELVAPPEGAQYKWLVGAADYQAPLEATAYGFDTFGRFGWVRPEPAQPHLEQFPDFVSANLSEPRTFRALLPRGFESSRGAAMRVALFHDGQNVFHPDAPFGGWRVDEALRAARFEDVVVLAIDNAPDRMDAYTHVADDIGGVTGGRANDYLDLLEEEALPFFRARYGVTARGDALMIIGSSLGGLVTAYAALSRPALFGCGAAMSPTLGWGSFRPGATDALVSRWVTHGPVAMHLDSGGGVTGACLDSDSDGVEDDGDDRDNYCVTAQLRDALDGLGYDFGVDLSHWHEPGAAHNEAAWAARVTRALDACAAMGWRAP